MRKFLRHYLVPHEHNNFRSKLLHHSSLFFLALTMFLGAISINVVETKRPDILGISYSITQQELLEYTNQARKERGLSPLSLNESLIVAANAKASHMFANNYWAHFAPDGTSPWSFITNSGYQYVFAGENLAKGFTNSKSIVDAWMNSPSHRDNLLSDKYTEIGFAVSEGSLEGEETVLVVQMFGAQDVPAAPVPIAQEKAEPTSTVAPSVTVLPSKKSEIVLVPSITSTPTDVPASQTATIKEQDVNYIEERPVENTAFARITPSFLNTDFIKNPAINMQWVSKAFPTIIVSLLFLTLLLDFAVVHRRKIPRMVGNNIDHIMIVVMFLLLLIIQQVGSVL